MSEPTVVAVAYIPLSQAVICNACEGVQLVGVPRCRACASEQLMPLAAWLGSVNGEPPYDAVFDSIEAWAADRRGRG